MPIYTNCPGCKAALSLGEHLLGKKIRCKKCGHVFLVDEDEGPGERAQIQGQPRSSKRPAVFDEEEPAQPRHKQKQSDLPDIPSLRRSRWGLILALVLGGLMLLLLGGGTVGFAILYWGPSWSGALEQFDSDFRGAWPTPAPPPGILGAETPEESIVTLHIAAVTNEYAFEAIYDKASALADGGHIRTAGTRDGDRATILVAPVHDPEACARKIDFGTVRRVNGRTISVVAHKIEGLPADADALTKALYHLKSARFTRRLEAAQRLKKIPPNERRPEVAQALQEALSKDHNHLDRTEIVEALAIWGTKDSVPFLLNALVEEENPFARWAIFNALARFQDERACEPLALHLEDFADRQEAAAALKAMGPMAEKVVLKRLQHPDHWVRWEACKILRVIGTKESLEALQRATADEEGFVPDEARGAIQAIKARQK